VGRIPDDVIDTVRERIDLVELVGRYVALKRSGRTWKGLCPFHSEKTPSFQVNPDRGIYHCFGCDESGNAFAFLMRQEGLTFPEAVRALAAECGVPVPETGGAPAGISEQLLAALGVAQRVYCAALASPAGGEAREYLARRGLDDATLERFGVGFAPDRWDAVVGALAAERIPAAVGERAGLLRARESGGHYDLLRNRITFPIRDARGRIIAFGGRALGVGQEPKYLNSPETPVFRKREAFYGLPEALGPMAKSERAVVVEGYFDLIALHRAGVGESLATCGTALGEEHAQQLRRRTRQVTLLFDGDEAGQRAMLRALAVLLPADLRVRAVALPGGLDPDDFLAKEGRDALRALVNGARPALETAIRRAVGAGCSTPWEKTDAVAEVAPLLAAVREPVERAEFARQLAWATGCEAREVQAAVRRAGREPGVAAGGPGPVVAPRLASPLAPREERQLALLAGVLLAHPVHAAHLEEADLLAAAPEGEWRELLAGLWEACQGRDRVDAAEVGERLGPEARRRLFALAAEDSASLADPDVALRALRETLGWLRRRRASEQARALTKRFRDPEADAAALLLEKQRQLERRRASGGPEPGPAATR
jgi:DNA primase